MAAPGQAAELDIGHPAPQRQVVGPYLLAFAVLAAPVAWSAEVLINLSVTSPACYPKDHPLNAPAFGGVMSALTWVQLAVFAIGLAGVAAAVVCWMRTRGEGHGGPNQLVEVGEGRTRFVAMCAMMLSIGFVVAMVFTSASFFLIRLC